MILPLGKLNNSSISLIESNRYTFISSSDKAQDQDTFTSHNQSINQSINVSTASNHSFTEIMHFLNSDLKLTHSNLV